MKTVNLAWRFETEISPGGDAASRLSLRDYLRVGQVSEAGRGAAAHSLAARDGNSSIPEVCLDTWNGLARRSDTCAECFCSRRIINGQRLRMLNKRLEFGLGIFKIPYDQVWLLMKRDRIYEWTSNNKKGRELVFDFLKHWICG